MAALLPDCFKLSERNSARSWAETSPSRPLTHTLPALLESSPGRSSQQHQLWASTTTPPWERGSDFRKPDSCICHAGPHLYPHSVHCGGRGGRGRQTGRAPHSAELGGHEECHVFLRGQTSGGRGDTNHTGEHYSRCKFQQL